MKAFRFARVLVAISGVLSLSALPSCGGYDCGAKGKCKNDAAPDPSDAAACKMAEAGKCGSQYADLQSCVRDSETCDASGDGHLDLPDFYPETLQYSGNCADEGNALYTCCLASPADGCASFSVQ